MASRQQIVTQPVPRLAKQNANLDTDNMFFDSGALPDPSPQTGSGSAPRTTRTLFPNPGQNRAGTTRTRSRRRMRSISARSCSQVRALGCPIGRCATKASPNPNPAQAGSPVS